MRVFFLLPGKSAEYFYRPLALLPWTLAAKTAGTSLWIYHLENVLLNMAAAVSFFFLLEKLGNSVKKSFLASLIFISGTASAAIAGFAPNLSYPLLLTLMNLSFLSGICFLGTNSKSHLFCHVFFFALGLFTLETGIGFVPVFLFYVLFVHESNIPLEEYCSNHPDRIRKQAAVLACLYAAVFAAWFIMRRLAVGGGLPANAGSAALANIPALFSPLNNFFMPFMARPLARAGYSAAMILGAAIAAALALLPLRRQLVINRRLYALGGIVYLCFLVPSMLSVFEFNDMPHRGYIPCAGLLIMLSQINWDKLVANSRIRRTGVFAFILFSALFSQRLCSYYSSGDSFWKKAMSDYPGYHASYYQIINLRQFSGDYAAAAETAEKLLEMNPQNHYARFIYASNLANSGEKTKAEAEFLKTIEETGGNPKYLSAYGMFLQEAGRMAEAENAFRKAVAADYLYQAGHYNYGNFFLSQGKWQEAEKEYRAALSSEKDIISVNVDEADCRKKLAYVILRQAENAKNNEEMFLMAAEAVKNAPYPEVYEHSAYLLMEKNEYAAAEKMFIFALNAEPGRISSAIGAGIAAAKAGNIPKSAEYLRMALKIDPENAKAKEILEKITKS